MLTRTLTSVVALAWASGAYAQAAPSPSAASPAQATDVVQVEDIIVTAQRRSERLIDVPISITTVAAQDIERAGGEAVENLTKTVPGVYIQRAVYGVSPTVRGVGSTLGTLGGEQNVSIYLDGVYQADASANTFDLANISSVEVLKGPQGTLFGRNATGGAMLVTTLDPSFTPGGKVNLSYERFNQVRASAYATAPLSDTFAVNGAVAYRHSNGYIRDNRSGRLVNEGETLMLRGKALWQPTDQFSAVVSASHSEFDDPTAISYQALFLAPAYAAPGNNAGPIAYDRFHLSHDTRGVLKTRADAASAKFKLDLDAGVLTAITAYQTGRLTSTNDLDATYSTIPAAIVLPPPLPPLTVGVIPTQHWIDLRTQTKTFTQEVNFTSKGEGPFSYVAGLYYYHQDYRVPGLFTNGAPSLHGASKNAAYAVYVDGSYDFGALTLIAGLRYTYEKRKSWNGVGAVDPAPFTRIQTDDDSQVTPRVGLRYALSERSNVYATFTRGFKSGTFDASSPNGPPVKAETIEAYEVGYKISEPAFSFNASAFYYDYLDTQVNATVSGSAGIFNQLFNVPKSRIYGLDVDGTYRFSRAFDVRAAVAYTHARYIDFPFAPAYSNVVSQDTGFGLVFQNGSADASGNNMVRAPELTVSTAFNYHADLGHDRRLDISVSPHYSSRVFFTFDNSLSQGGYTLLDANATLSLGQNLTLSVFGRNLTDKAYSVGKNINNLLAVTNFGAPRTYGVSLGYSF